MKKSRFEMCGFDTYFNLWPMIDVINAYAKDAPTYVWSETLEAVETSIGRFKWCKDICFAHQAWCSFDFETTRIDTLQRRIALTQAKLDRLANRWTISK